MPRIFTHAVYNEKEIPTFLRDEILGKREEAMGFQPKRFENTPLVFCSYVCKGYPYTHVALSKHKIEFETDTAEVYASPCDTQEFLRGGIWLTGYEKFLFPTLEKLLEKYPTSEEFKADFQEFFKKLNPHELRPHHTKRSAELEFEMDYCLKDKWIPGCNEITFPKPLKIKNARLIKID